MTQGLALVISLFISFSAMAESRKCSHPLRNTQGLTPMSLSDSYLLKIHKTLAGELDPVVLGDGGVVTATWVAGVQPNPREGSLFFVIYEGDSDHLQTSKIDKAYYAGWPYVIIKTNCLSEMKSDKHVQALQSLVWRHMKPPRGSHLKYYIFE